MKGKPSEPLSYAECVRRVVRAAKSPVPFQEIVHAVAGLRPITSRHPEQTIRNALAQTRQIVHTGEGYGYLPYLLRGNVFRLTVDFKALRSGTLILSNEVFCALWPSFFEFTGPKDERPPRIQLQKGRTFIEPIQMVRKGDWGWNKSRVLYDWLRQRGAKRGDDLILTVIDAETRRYTLRLERRSERDSARLEERNRAIRQAALDLWQVSRGAPMWDLAPRLIARGWYRDPCPPDPLLPMLEPDLPKPRPAEQLSPQARREQALDLLDEGIEWHAQGNTREAEKRYWQSVVVDAAFADGYNHLGNLAFERRDRRRAEEFYQLAFDTARKEFNPDNRLLAWWGMIETRPLMRALHGLGLCKWRLGAPRPAIAIFEGMLRMNPNDNQGVRYLIGALYHELGNRKRAEDWYRKTADDPHVMFNWALLCWEKGERVHAVTHMLQGMVQNPYLAPMLLGEHAARLPFWHATNLEEPETAAEYLDLYRHLWRRQGARRFLRAVWRHPRARAYLDDFVLVRTKLTNERVMARRTALVDAEFRLRRASIARPVAQAIVRDFDR